MGVTKLTGRNEIWEKELTENILLPHQHSGTRDHCAVGVQSISWFCNKAHFWIIIKLIPCCFIICFAKEYSASLKSNHFRFRGSENHEILAVLIINHARQIVWQFLKKEILKSCTVKNHKGVRVKSVFGTWAPLLTLTGKCTAENLKLFPVPF